MRLLSWNRKKIPPAFCRNSYPGINQHFFLSAFNSFYIYGRVFQCRRRPYPYCSRRCFRNRLYWWWCNHALRFEYPGAYNCCNHFCCLCCRPCLRCSPLFPGSYNNGCTCNCSFYHEQAGKENISGCKNKNPYNYL